MIPVTKPYLPPKEDFSNLIDGIFDRNWLTNDGPLVQKLEHELNSFLETAQMTFVANGTLALQLAIKALNLEGEVITTPFSYVATTSSIVWEGLKPIFVDIENDSWNIDPSKIEEQINTKTSAIVATHVFGVPCKIDQIASIAKKYDLKVIYDASHCFAAKFKGRSVYSYGDISTASFHATKLFHTIEGGGIFSSNNSLDKKVRYLRNFGHDGFDNYNGIGINAKNSEVHAAMGLVMLDHINHILQSRKEIVLWYESMLSSIIKRQLIPEESKHNHAYYPVVLESESQCLEIKKALEKRNIFPRRYFYPLLSTLDYVDSGVGTPIADQISKSILCLPLYVGIRKNQVEEISEIINNIAC